VLDENRTDSQHRPGSPGGARVGEGHRPGKRIAPLGGIGGVPLALSIKLAVLYDSVTVPPNSCWH
jgi:hypothetical protein